jgi:hypothetical protein
LFDLYTNLPKSFKYTLGQRIQLESIEMIVNIYKANAHVDKVPFIIKIREHIEIIRLLIRILHDTKQISLKRMVLVNVMIEEISKQLVGSGTNRGQASVSLSINL